MDEPSPTSKAEVVAKNKTNIDLGLLESKNSTDDSKSKNSTFKCESKNNTFNTVLGEDGVVEILLDLELSESKNSTYDSESKNSTLLKNSKNSIFHDVILSNSIYVPLPDKNLNKSEQESEGEEEEVVPRRSRSLSTLRSKSPPPPRFRCTNTTKLTSTVPETTQNKLGFKAELPTDLTTVAPIPKHTLLVCSLLTTNTDTENELDSIVVQNHPRRKLVGKPMFAHVYLNNVPVVALIDPGSAVNVISHSLYTANQHWPTAKIDVDLSFANS